MYRAPEDIDTYCHTLSLQDALPISRPANVQEVALARELVQGDELMVYADRGYDAAWLHDHLAAQGIADGIMRRARRNQMLDPAAIVRNHALSLRRRTVEKPFGTLKRSYRLARPTGRAHV